MAGNGGQMAGKYEAVQEPGKRKQGRAATKDKARRKAGVKQQNGTRCTTRGQSGTGTEPESNGQVKTRMSAEVNLALGQRCREIANALLMKTLLGDARSADLLFSLAEPKNGSGSSLNKRLRDLALALENEPELPGDWTEAATVMFGGGAEN
jgi:hypothetical protein